MTTYSKEWAARIFLKGSTALTMREAVLATIH